MIDSKVYEEWEKLCEEHAAARDAHFKALGDVTRKFSAIAQGTSKENPSTQELSNFDRTGKEWENIKNKMSAFVKKHT